MVAKRVSETELATSLTEVLERVRTGERFEIERDGEVIATIAPIRTALGTTWGEFTARVPNLELPGEGFADDLEAARKNLLATDPPE